ncbi:hypothetical protein B0H10DRAFT_1712694, partial [Mycena sp. CBHHK59/15]
ILQLCTGHCILNKHLHRIKKSDTPLCPCCHQREEMVQHHLLECPAHQNAHHELCRLGGCDAQYVDKLLSKKELFPLLFRFIASASRF